MVEFYNIAAILYYYIRKHNENRDVINCLHKFYKMDKAQIPSEQNETKQFITKFCTDHIDEFELMKRKGKSFNQEGGSFVEEELRMCMLLLSAINHYCGFRDEVEKAKLNHDTLNTDYKDYVEMYASYSGIRRNNTASDEYWSYFPNLVIFVKIGEFRRNCNITNIYLDGDETKLRIGCIPYPTGINPYVCNGDKVSCNKKQNITDNDKLFLNKCDKARLSPSNCDILMAPEMYGSKKLDSILKNHFCVENGCRLVFCPSYYETKLDGNTYNRATVYAIENRTITHKEYIKLDPARFGDGTHEDISSAPNFNIFVIHVKNIGRISLCICSDYFKSEIRSLIEELNIDLVLLQCYSEKTSDFISRMQDSISKKHFVVLLNACQAVKDYGKEHIYYGNYLYDHGNTSVNNQLISIKCTRSSCDCDVCFSILEFEVKREYNARGLETEVIIKELSRNYNTENE